MEMHISSAFQWNFGLLLPHEHHGLSFHNCWVGRCYIKLKFSKVSHKKNWML
jgi:hypothetical protein